ncbi:hypothetical protein IH992_30670 [Candidatus Poribacteria bacterium]|nr:hypothetical protein [Candidatus Poribacteria bacterium]
MRIDSQWSLYGQRIDKSGKQMWPNNGVEICRATAIQGTPRVIKGGVVVVSQDDRDVFPDIYAQCINADDTPQWKANGIPICTAGGHQTRPMLQSGGNMEFFVAWVDYRQDYGIESKTDVYGQQLRSDGTALWEENGIHLYTTVANVPQVPMIVMGTPDVISLIWSDGQDVYMRRIP